MEHVNYTEIENEDAEFLVKTEEAGSSEGGKAGKDCSQEDRNEVLFLEKAVNLGT